MRVVPDQEVEYVDFPIYHQELESALRFTPSDLAANRSGKLSEAQRALLVKDDAKRIGCVVISLAVAAGCTSIAFAIGITTGLSLRILLLAAIAVFVAGVLGFTSFRLWDDVRRGAVSTLEGFVTPGERETHIDATSGPGTSVVQFYWTVDRERFYVSGKAYGVLTPARHRLYFLPLTRRIVAAEPISGKSG
jgi:hypothetical protein